LPSTRLLHQPERRGRSPLSLSSELDTTGSIEGAGGVKDGGGEFASSCNACGAGSRTVERRRGASGTVGSETSGSAACGDGAACGSASGAAGKSLCVSEIGIARGAGRPAEFRLDGYIPREVLALATAPVAPSTAPAAATTAALALAVRLLRLFAATH